MKNTYYILFLFLLSCNCGPRLDVLHFNDVQNLDGEEIILDDNITFASSYNNRIIAFDNSTKTNFLSIYDDSTYELITRLAQYGKGENEFISVLYMKFNSINRENRDMSAMVMDNIKPMYYMINIDKSIRESKCIIEDTIKNNRNNLIMHNGVINDSLALCISTKNHSFYLYNYINQVSKQPIYVNEGIVNKRNERSLSNSCVYNINIDRYFIYYHIINRVISCNGIGSDRKDYAVNKRLINYNNIKDSDDPLLINRYYMDCVYDDNYIYLLCGNMSLNDYSNPNPVTIDVFDWHSNPVIKLKIKETLNTLALNSKKNILYGTTYSGQFFKYQLPAFN